MFYGFFSQPIRTLELTNVRRMYHGKYILNHGHHTGLYFIGNIYQINVLSWQWLTSYYLGNIIK